MSTMGRSWVIAAAALLFAGLLHADDAEGSRRSLGGDEFAAGGSVRIEQPVGGDLLAAGGNVDVEAPIGGDVLLVGGHLRIAAPVRGSVLGGGGRLVLDGPVGRNVRVGGGQVELNPKSVVAFPANSERPSMLRSSGLVTPGACSRLPFSATRRIRTRAAVSLMLTSFRLVK